MALLLFIIYKPWNLSLIIREKKNEIQFDIFHEIN